MAESKSATLPALVVASPFCLLLGFVFLLSKNMAGDMLFLLVGRVAWVRYSDPMRSGAALSCG